MDNPERIITTEKLDEEDLKQDKSLRPKKLTEFIGQQTITENLKVFIESSKMRKQALDHILLAGPPGLGKTTLAFIVAEELGVNIKATSAPIIDKSGDLVSILTSLEDNDVLFIDEIHRLSPAIEEILYPAMEDRTVDILIGQGVGAKSIKIDLAAFTLIGATTRTGLLTAALRDRFGIPLRLKYYSSDELKIIAERTSHILGKNISQEAALEIAKRSRKTPRIVNRLVNRVIDFTIVNKLEEIDLDITRHSLKKLEIDNLGLDEMDRKILSVIIDKYDGGPVGVKTIAMTVGEEMDTLEEYYEPFLVQEGLIKRTSRGRMATMAAYNHLGIKYSGSNEIIEDNTLF